MKKIFLLVLLSTIYSVILACFCGPYESNFYKNVSPESKSCIVVVDTLYSQYPINNMHGDVGFFILLDTFNNIGSEIGDTILVYGQDGLNCGETLSKLNIGDTLVLNLLHGYYDRYKDDIFYLDGCGKNFLEIKNGRNSGLTIDQIKQKIKDIQTSVFQFSESKINVYPTLFTSHIYVDVSDKEIIEIQLFDLSCKVIHTNSNITNRNYKLTTSDIKPGAYILRIKTRNEIISKKVFKYQI